MTNSDYTVTRPILCIETATDVCSVGVARAGEIVALREEAAGRDHARVVATYTAEVLDEARLRVADLGAVAVIRGPGSYTGLRIGVSFAKGLCLAGGIPLIGIGSLDSLCAVAREGSGGRFARYIPMIDARRMEVYGEVFDPIGTPLTPPEAWIVQEGSLVEWHSAGEVAIFGSGAAKCREVLPWAQYLEVAPSARGMAALAAEAFAAGRIEDTAYFEPFYLKDFVVTTSKKRLF